jgi:hypothetical protein
VGDLERTLLAWQAEVEQVEREIANLTRTEGVLTDFAAWWAAIRDNLVTVRSTTLVQGGQVVASVPTVVCETDRLRALLKKLGLRVTIFWKPKFPGSLYHVVDTARITAQVGVDASQMEALSSARTRD